MNASHTSTLTDSAFISYHGVAAVSYTEAMDVDTDGQRPRDPNPDNHLMDITLDGAHTNLDKGKAPESRPSDDLPSEKNETTAATESTQVLERPREGGDDEAREPPIQIRKTPH